MSCFNKGVDWFRDDRKLGDIPSNINIDKLFLPGVTKVVD
jgi:hypothetical protein